MAIEIESGACEGEIRCRRMGGSVGSTDRLIDGRPAGQGGKRDRRDEAGTMERKSAAMAAAEGEWLQADAQVGRQITVEYFSESEAVGRDGVSLRFPRLKTVWDKGGRDV